MSLADLKFFLKSIHPFELLSEKELQIASDSINIAYYKKDTLLVCPEQKPQFFYIIIKGEVSEYLGEEFIKNYHTGNSFDADAIIYDKTEHRFVVSEELICYELPKEKFLKLLESNQSFKSYFLNDLADKIRQIKQKEYATGLSDFMIARVVDAYVRKPCLVGADTPLKEAIALSIELKSGAILVKNGKNLGIITDSDIKKSVLSQNFDLEKPCGSIAKFEAICIEKNDFLFNALLLLTKYSIKRVAVVEDGEVVGVLEQLDLLSYFANHSHLVLTQINNAKNKEELKAATQDFINIIKKLFAKGVRVEYISRLICELNDKVYEKLYHMVVPAEIADKGCLIVMGSEGRKEQILRTDQDNALIVADGVDAKIFEKPMEEFSQSLIEFGFPPCEGNVMVSNPFWRKNRGDFQKELRIWIDESSGEELMNLAIFFDSMVVAGDKELLESLKNYIFGATEDKIIFMANFAKTSLSFETPIGIFTKFTTEKGLLDLKKGGIFAIVQGVRSLALKYKIKDTDTFTRIHKLKDLKVLEDRFAQELLEAFDAFLNIRLKEGLLRIDKGKNPTNLINPKNLGTLEVDLLKESFRIVNKFKKFLSYHFKLNIVS